MKQQTKSQNEFIECWKEQGRQEMKKEIIKIINEWNEIKCIDGKEKCHECVGELRQKIQEKKE